MFIAGYTQTILQFQSECFHLVGVQMESARKTNVNQRKRTKTVISYTTKPNELWPNQQSFSIFAIRIDDNRTIVRRAVM